MEDEMERDELREPEAEPEPPAEEPAAVTEPEPVGVEAEAAPAGSELPYTEGEWSGKPNYQCTVCNRYATLDKARIESHLRDRHGIGRMTPKGIVLFGPDGELLRR